MSQGLLRCNAGREEGLELFQQPGLKAFSQFVFPNPGDFPTQFPQRIIYAAIPRLVAGNRVKTPPCARLFLFAEDAAILG